MKTLLKIIAVLFLLGVIALVAVGFFINPIITKTVNTVGPKVTGTKVELASSNISLLTGGGSLKGLFVGNPEGWTGDKAFYLGQVRASVKPGSLLGDYVMVNEVFIDGPEFVYEKRLIGGSNIEALLKQIEANTGGGKGTTSAEPAKDGQSGKPMKFAVKSFVLKDAKVSVVAGGQTIAVTLPTITITDLGIAEGGITPDQVATAVLKRVLAQMGPAAAQALTKIGAGAIEGGSEGAKGALNKLLGK